VRVDHSGKDKLTFEFDFVPEKGFTSAYGERESKKRLSLSRGI
jgi:hypothetical protein